MAKSSGKPRTESKRSGSPATGAKRVTAETMAAKQREISVSEFFAKNRHLLGFDNPRKALLTTVKEAVDNALDACEEAGILPDITVQIEHLPKAGPDRFRVTVTDNGPGIVRRQVENIFGKLLYGSKFHRLKMSRGQQGIGISAAGMYGLMTTGRPMVITTKPHKSKPAHHIELAMDTTKNKPEVTIDIETDDFPTTSSGTGTRVSLELEARYIKGKTSVDAYLEQTAIANPHAQITFLPPAKSAIEEEATALKPEAPPDDAEVTKALIESKADAEGPLRTIELDDRLIFPRGIAELPHEAVEIKPHPYGVELGTFLRMLKQTDETQLGGFMKKEFCRVTPAVASQVYKAAGVTGQSWVSRIDHATAEKIYKNLQASKLRAPPTDCLSPIGVRTLLAGLLKGVKAEFYAASTRSPAVYRGMPFQIEAAVAFGGELPGDESARVIRFANRVPLLYQQSACCSFKSVVETAWRGYGLAQPRNGAPVGPLVVMIHMASVWVPFTSESKEAIADYDEIRKEMKLALQECGRKLGTYIRRRKAMRKEGERRDVFERYIGEIAKACNAITGADAKALYDALQRQAQRRTELADAILDEDGKIIGRKSEQLAGSNGRLDKDDGVIILGSPNDAHAAAALTEPAVESKPAKRSKKPKPGAKVKAKAGTKSGGKKTVKKKTRAKPSGSGLSGE
ncbi:MAG: DNA topoisomerase VI subunit B [Phycisphaerales bacterium]|nr:MAG: DNA topoisomerase VI subunit B [Phycisphaerales bacterium]